MRYRVALLVTLLVTIAAVFAFLTRGVLRSADASPNKGSKAISAKKPTMTAAKKPSVNRAQPPKNPVAPPTSQRKEQILEAGIFTPVSVEPDEPTIQPPPELHSTVPPPGISRQPHDTILKITALKTNSSGTTNFRLHVYLVRGKGRFKNNNKVMFLTGGSHGDPADPAREHWVWLDSGSERIWDKLGVPLEGFTQVSGSPTMYTKEITIRATSKAKGRGTYLFVVESDQDLETTFVATSVHVGP